MRIIQLLGKLLSRLLTALLAIILLCNLYTIAARHFTGALQPDVFGWSWAVVISGSMEPEIKVNDLVIVHEEESYTVGDIIAYESGSSVVTHRIVAESEMGYTTQGDFNNAADSRPVPKAAVVGRVVHVVPKVGLLLEYLRTPLGMTCMVLVGFLLIEIPYITDKYRKEQGGCK